MNLLLFSTFTIICAAAVESRYPYEDTYTPGDIVPHGISGGYPYNRDVGGYGRRSRGGGGGYSGLGGSYRRNNGYGGAGYNGRYRDGILDRDYRRRHRDYDSNLPPRGIGGYKKPSFKRPHGYEGGRYGRPGQIPGPPKYYDEDEFSYGGYNRNIGIGIGGRHR